MKSLHDVFEAKGLASPFSLDLGEHWAGRLGSYLDMDIYPRSFAVKDGTLYFLGRRAEGKFVGALSAKGVPDLEGESRLVQMAESQVVLQVGPANAHNAQVLRERLSYLQPRTLGLSKSVGCGDRLGLATPGHVRAVRKHTMAPIFAQQSIREMERTGRSPQQVMDDAMWGAFQEGWRQGFGADADHLKTFDHIDRCVDAGFTFYTIDPSEYVDNAAETDGFPRLWEKVEDLPWNTLDASIEKLRAYYVGQTFDLGEFQITFTEETLLRAAAKYGKAVAHTVRMYHYLKQRMGERPFELEMSVDETDSPTTVTEHFFVANELRRLGVRWVSLAPRFVGRFEKGVDYIGDLKEFEETFRQHVAIARALGPYKLSLHSGSDKFSIYPIAAALAGDLVHLKTAGTSYLVALEVVARYNPSLFREILAFARDRYDHDRVTYHVSAEVDKVPPAEELADEELPDVIHDFNGRQVLHVTFGSVLTAKDARGNFRFRQRLLDTLWKHEEAYSNALEVHFDRHLSPFDRYP